MTADDEAIAAATDDPERAALDRWMVLSEERVVVTKQTVPVERIRLQINTVTEDKQVAGRVRAERIEMDSTPSRNHQA